MNCTRRFAILIFATASSPLLLYANEQGEQLTSASATAGLVTVTSSVDKATTSVAEPLHLKLVVEAPLGTRIEWPSLGKKLGDMDLTHTAMSNNVPSSTNQKLREWVLQLTLESIKTGDLAIPALDVRYATDSTSEFHTVRSSPLSVHIA